MPRTQPDIEKTDKTGKDYAIDLFYGDVKLTNYLKRLRITNSITAGWPRIIAELNISAKDIIHNNIYGQKDFRLEISTIGSTSSGDPIENVTYYLMYMQSNLDMIPQGEDDNEIGGMRQNVILVLVPTYSINVLGTFLNIIIDREDPDRNITSSDEASIATIFKNIFTKKLGFPSTSLEMDFNGINTDAVTELIIPPMSMRQCLEYLDSRFTFYKDGAFFYYCNKDGKLKIWNLFDRIDKNAILKIYQLPGTNVDDKIVEDIVSSGLKDDVFYTVGPISTNNYANSILLRQGHTNCFVSKPEDRLYRFHCADLEDIDEDIEYHNNLSMRRKYFTDLSSFNGNLIKNIVGQNFKNMFRLKVPLTGLLISKNLVRVGEPVEIKPRNISYLNYQGSYILESSDIVYNRTSTTNWVAECTLTMFRPYQIQKQPGVKIRRNTPNDNSLTYRNYS